MQKFGNEQSKIKRIACPAIKSQSQTLYILNTACIRHAPIWLLIFPPRKKQLRVIRLCSYKILQVTVNETKLFAFSYQINRSVVIFFPNILVEEQYA